MFVFLREDLLPGVKKVETVGNKAPDKLKSHRNFFVTFKSMMQFKSWNT